ncbi:hypothetical protein ACFQRL_13745 [Microbacterium fluvii]|uniref:Uncharacterized protein n=1 Tax=Microbacterium fluvii TaxID=415215 RepID=A0ABW2HFV8_9MICO|nr:hypothetical protein [Microbacterium fluvii]MCU4673654.1 hypothetical protein [Microbacterium fluvii]
MTDETSNDTTDLTASAVADAPAADDVADQADAAEPQAADAAEAAPQYGVGPFSIREVALVGIWLVAFVTSFFPVSVTWLSALGPAQITWSSVWASGLSWVLTVGLPTVAVFLIVLRRLSPDGIRRVGSLGVDQFASVAFSVATLVWLQQVWETVNVAAETGYWLRSWVMWLQFFLMLAGVLLTVFGPFIPPFDQDFRHRAEVPAHPTARPARPVSARPAPAPRPAGVAEPGAADESDARFDPADPYATSAALDDTYESPAADTVVVDRITAEEATPAETPARQQAFWALVPEERDVVDDLGIPLFRIAPTAWALVIEDRGEVFVVRHEDGRVGYLHDTTDVTRG